MNYSIKSMGVVFATLLVIITLLFLITGCQMSEPEAIYFKEVITEGGMAGTWYFTQTSRDMNYVFENILLVNGNIETLPMYSMEVLSEYYGVPIYVMESVQAAFRKH